MVAGAAQHARRDLGGRSGGGTRRLLGLEVRPQVRFRETSIPRMQVKKSGILSSPSFLVRTSIDNSTRFAGFACFTLFFSFLFSLGFACLILFIFACFAVFARFFLSFFHVFVWLCLFFRPPPPPLFCLLCLSFVSSTAAVAYLV